MTGACEHCGGQLVVDEDIGPYGIEETLKCLQCGRPIGTRALEAERTRLMALQRAAEVKPSSTGHGVSKPTQEQRTSSYIRTAASMARQQGWVAADLGQPNKPPDKLDRELVPLWHAGYEHRMKKGASLR